MRSSSNQPEMHTLEPGPKPLNPKTPNPKTLSPKPADQAAHAKWQQSTAAFNWRAFAQGLGAPWFKVQGL